MTTAERIGAVIAGGGPKMLYQPITEIATRTVVGYEALARFPDPDAVVRLINTGAWRAEMSHCGIGPEPWFAAADLYGLGVDLELSAVAAGTAAWERLPAGRYVAVNASPATILSGRIPVAVNGCPWSRVLVELTEHAPVADYGALREACDLLRAWGSPTCLRLDRMRLAVDDAGAGYASFSHIAALEPDVVKIDRSLVRGIDGQGRAAESRRIVARHVIGAARDLGARVAAEGVESAPELEAVWALGCELAQGYYLGVPEPLVVIGAGD